MTEQAEDNPLEQLIELFVYAPIGMLYEYPDVLPQLIKRGRSQVQLAKFFGQMAAKQGASSMSETPVAGAGAAGAQATDALAKLAARFITELGSQVGLAPPSGEPTPPAAAAAPVTESEAVPGDDPGGPEPEAESTPTKTARLPIAGYDELTAKEIIGVLDDLTQDQLMRVRNHETRGRNRKTVLAKIDRLVA